MRRLTRASLYLLGGLALACEDDPETGTVEGSTLIVVDPARFLGNLPCSPAAPGGVRRYVATVVDVSLSGVEGDQVKPELEFPLPASPPVPCTDTVSFSNVVSGHWYVADIQAYDREDIEPRGPGSFLMVDTKTGKQVEPRWATSCGRASAFDPLLALYQNVRTLHRCAPLVALDANGTTAISVSLSELLGGRKCGAATGQVSRYRATLDGTDAKTEEAECASDLSFDGLESDRQYRLLVQAFEGDSKTARWVTSCFAKTALGVTVPATCDPLQDDGTGGTGGAAGMGGAGGAAGAAGADTL